MGEFPSLESPPRLLTPGLSKIYTLAQLCTAWCWQPRVIPGVPNAFHVTRGTISADDGATCVRAADLNEASLVAEPLHVLQKVLHLTT